VVAEEIEAAIDAADERLRVGLLQAQLRERLVHDLHRAAQLVARGRQHDHVVHVAHEEEPGGFEPLVEFIEEERSQQR